MSQERNGKRFAIDTSTDFGARVARQLQEETIAWLTTIGADSTPLPSPVWFYWDGETVTVYSEPNAPKVRNILRGSRVSLSLNTPPDGEAFVVLTGDAWIDEAAPAINANAGYLQKYREGLKTLTMTVDELARDYSAAVRIRPTALRGF
jgi:PPOX class probable F420-dependent enzyme